MVARLSFKQVSIWVLLAVMAFGLTGQVLAQDPTPLPDRALEEGAGFELVNEWDVEGERVTQVTAAPDGSTVCVVTDDTLLTCTDSKGRNGFTHSEPNGIIAVLIGLYSGDVVVIHRGIDAASPYITKIGPAGDVLGTASFDGTAVGNPGDALIARLDPQSETVVIARNGGNTLLKVDISIKSWSTSGDADDRPTEEVAFVFAAKDLVVTADGSMVALADDGQVHRASPGGAFNPVMVATDDINTDGSAEIITSNAALVMMGQGNDDVYVVGQRLTHVSDEPEQFVMRVERDVVVPIARWKVEEGESWKVEEGESAHTSRYTGLEMTDGSLLIGLSANLVYQIDPMGAVKKVPVPGKDIASLLGDDIGILIFSDRAATPSLLRIDAESSQLQEFMLGDR